MDETVIEITLGQLKRLIQDMEQLKSLVQTYDGEWSDTFPIKLVITDGELRFRVETDFGPRVVA